VDTFGELSLADLEHRAVEIAAWRRTLPEGSRYGITQALRQTLEAAVRWRLMRENPAKAAGRNTQPKRAEIHPFTRSEIDGVATELGEAWGPIVVLAAETGLMPSEWIALEWRDLHRREGVLLVERSYTRGQLKGYGKTSRRRRRVPLSARALDTLGQVTRRLDTPLVFPAAGGGHLDLHNWRAREWIPAVDAAGLGRGRRIYDLRHTFASEALAAGVLVYDVARVMGTSVRMIDLTYGHLAPGSEDTTRALLDARARAIAEAAREQRS
jgi:integrase